MSDYDTDEDNYNDQDDLPELENNQPDNMNGWGNVPANPVNPVNPDDPVYQLNEKKKEFDGSVNIKNNWTQCFYCNKFHPASMHLPDMTYCGHCWGWLNSDQLKLTEGVYVGPNTIDEVKNFLKLTFPLHPITCVNQECVYNKIKQLAQTKTLHLDFCVELGFMKLDEKTEKNNKSEYEIKKNKRYTKINYKLSSIII